MPPPYVPPTHLPRNVPAPGHFNNVIRPDSASAHLGPLLGPLLPCDLGRPCLVLDLDETLVHSSFKPMPVADYVLPVEIDGTVHPVYVLKRPGCDAFLERTGALYEVVVFTASLAKYADPLLDLLDPTGCLIRARLFREACVFHGGAYVKDLSLLGRDPTATIIVDNSPASYAWQPENALPCGSYIDDPADTELWGLGDFLTCATVARSVDVREPLAQWVGGTFSGYPGSLLTLDDLPHPDALAAMGQQGDEEEEEALGPHYQQQQDWEGEQLLLLEQEQGEGEAGRSDDEAEGSQAERGGRLQQSEEVSSAGGAVAMAAPLRPQPASPPPASQTGALLHPSSSAREGEGEGGVLLHPSSSAREGEGEGGRGEGGLTGHRRDGRGRRSGKGRDRRVVDVAQLPSVLRGDHEDDDGDGSIGGCDHEAAGRGLPLDGALPLSSSSLHPVSAGPRKLFGLISVNEASDEDSDEEASDEDSDEEASDEDSDEEASDEDSDEEAEEEGEEESAQGGVGVVGDDDDAADAAGSSGHGGLPVPQPFPAADGTPISPPRIPTAPVPAAPPAAPVDGIGDEKEECASGRPRQSFPPLPSTAEAAGAGLHGSSSAAAAANEGTPSGCDAAAPATPLPLPPLPIDDAASSPPPLAVTLMPPQWGDVSAAAAGDAGGGAASAAGGVPRPTRTPPSRPPPRPPSLGALPALSPPSQRGKHQQQQQQWEGAAPALGPAGSASAPPAPVPTARLPVGGAAPLAVSLSAAHWQINSPTAHHGTPHGRALAGWWRGGAEGGDSDEVLPTVQSGSNALPRDTGSGSSSGGGGGRATQDDGGRQPVPRPLPSLTAVRALVFHADPSPGGKGPGPRPKGGAGTGTRTVSATTRTSYTRGSAAREDRSQ